MSKLQIQSGATSQSITVFIQNSSVTTGAGLTGLVFNTSSLIAYYNFNGGVSNAITLATLVANNSAYSSGGFIAVDGTNMPGLYRLDIPNAALAAGNGRSVIIMLSGAANMVPCLIEIELTAVNNQSTGFGLVNASSNVAQWNGSNVSVPATAGIPDINVKNIGGSTSTGVAGYVGVDWSHVNAPTTAVGLTGTTISTSQVVASVTGAVGSVTGNVGGSVASVTATVTANATQLAGQTITAAAGVTFPTSVASPTNITAGTITTVTNLTNAPTSGDFTATMKTSLNAATPASIVGAVGSVTGNVGGSVGSISGISFPSNFSSLSITAGGATKIDGTSPLVESYAAQGAALTLAQGIYGMNQLMSQQAIVGTTLTTKKRDGSTTAKTYTLDSASAPTLISETT